MNAPVAVPLVVPMVSPVVVPVVLPMAVPIIVWIWVGLLVGVSFIATPAKFLAPSLSLPHALEIGRATFGVFKWVECAAAVALLLVLVRQSLVWHSAPWLLLGLAVVAIAIMVLQYLWLLPVLDVRVEQILQGATPPPSKLHWAYIGTDLAKLVLLIFVGVAAYPDLQAR